MRNLLILGAALSTSILVSASPSFAAGALPGQSFSTECIDGNPFSESGGDGQSLCNVTDATAFVTGAPFASTQARITDSGVYTQIVDSHLIYYGVVTGGPEGATSVTLDVTADLLSEGTFGGTGFADFYIGPAANALAGAQVCNIADCTESQYHDTQSFVVGLGQPFEVHLDATAEGSGFDSTAFASADPLFFVPIDPNLYTIELSEGIDNGLPSTPGVPEPASWALMLAGFGLAGAALRGRRRGALAA